MAWVVGQRSWYYDPFDFELDLCPRTGAFRGFVARLGDHRPLADKVRGRSRSGVPVGGWAYTIERRRAEPVAAADHGLVMGDADRPEGESRAIADFLWWRRLMLVGWLGVIPSVAILNCVGIYLPVSAVPGMLAFGIGGFQAYLFRCPRCGNTFVWRWGWQNVFTNRCVHCAYSISGSKPPPPPSESTASATEAEPGAAADGPRL